MFLSLSPCVSRTLLCRLRVVPHFGERQTNEQNTRVLAGATDGNRGYFASQEISLSKLFELIVCTSEKILNNINVVV